jgi:hypothetical protein
MAKQSESDQFSPEETERRVQRALVGAFKGTAKDYRATIDKARKHPKQAKKRLWKARKAKKA